VVEYGDFECPYCGQAEPVVRDILTDTLAKVRVEVFSDHDEHEAGPADGPQPGDDQPRDDG